MADGEHRVVWGVGTPRTMRAHWILEELGLAYETRPIGSRTGETQTEAFRRLNPREKIPVLEDGPLVLAESAAIVTYLAERYGAGTALIPDPGTAERGAYYQWCCFILSELDATSLYVIRRHGDLANLYGDAPHAVRSAGEYFDKQVAVATRQLSDGRPFLLGDDFTGVDLMLNTVCMWGRFVGRELDSLLEAHLARTAGRPAHQRAFQRNYPPELRPA